MSELGKDLLWGVLFGALLIAVVSVLPGCSPTQGKIPSYFRLPLLLLFVAGVISQLVGHARESRFQREHPEEWQRQCVERRRQAREARRIPKPSEPQLSVSAKVGGSADGLMPAEVEIAAELVRREHAGGQV